jgi:hypothetical protein
VGFDIDHVPAKVLACTIGIDVKDDRLESHGVRAAIPPTSPLAGAGATI